MAYPQELIDREFEGRIFRIRGDQGNPLQASTIKEALWEIWRHGGSILANGMPLAYDAMTTDIVAAQGDAEFRADRHHSVALHIPANGELSGLQADLLEYGTVRTLDGKVRRATNKPRITTLKYIKGECSAKHGPRSASLRAHVVSDARPSAPTDVRRDQLDLHEDEVGSGDESSGDEADWARIGHGEIGRMNVGARKRELSMSSASETGREVRDRRGSMTGGIKGRWATRVRRDNQPEPSAFTATEGIFSLPASPMPEDRGLASATHLLHGTAAHPIDLVSPASSPTLPAASTFASSSHAIPHRSSATNQEEALFLSDGETDEESADEEGPTTGSERFIRDTLPHLA